MRKRMLKRTIALLAIIVIFLMSGVAKAATYSFSVPKETVNAFWNSDGTLSIDYVFDFNNDSSASAIDFVDVGIPTDRYDPNSIYADVNGKKVTNIAPSPYVKPGVAVGLGADSIQPGQSGQVHVFIGTVRNVLHQDTQDKQYASAVFSPSWFDSSFVHGTTDLSVTFHLPPGVQSEEPRWHSAPDAFPSQPQTGFDDQGRIIYTWTNPSANATTQYLFGASFPAKYVPASAIQRPSIWETLGISPEAVIGPLICFGVLGFFVLAAYLSVIGARRRKLQYLPPKVSIEGHGIKRGLTAVEAAILLEESMDKIMTMILFGVIKKGAASVTNRDPLTLDITKPQPEGLQPYEVQFLNAFEKPNGAERRKALQDMMVDLVNGVSNKMKGFSRKETIAYYRDIMNRAWAQVEAADTPEVKSEKFNEALEWTMLDKNYDDRTRRTFGGGPVFVPIWWPRYDPGYGRSIPSTPIPTGGGAGGGGVSLPNLPGSDFAASMVRGVQTFSGNVIGNLTDFTGRVTDRTNPVPVAAASTRGGGGRSGGGCVCACACACAGCACACAGGGR